MTRRRWIGLAAYAVALVAVVGGRGWFLAGLAGGRYPLAHLAFDVTAFAAVIVALPVFDAAVKRAVRWTIPQARLPGRALGHALHAVVLIGVGLPFLLDALAGVKFFVTRHLALFAEYKFLETARLSFTSRFPAGSTVTVGSQV